MNWREFLRWLVLLCQFLFDDYDGEEIKDLLRTIAMIVAVATATSAILLLWAVFLQITSLQEIATTLYHYFSLR